jgi:hypothetical protein
MMVVSPGTALRVIALAAGAGTALLSAHRFAKFLRNPKRFSARSFQRNAPATTSSLPHPNPENTDGNTRPVTTPAILDLPTATVEAQINHQDNVVIEVTDDR